MLTSLLVSMVVTCMPYRPPPVTVVRCDGADQVRLDAAGKELGRVPLSSACTRLRCEGTDWVLRTTGGVELERRVESCLPALAPVKLTNQPGWKFGLSGRG